MPVQKIISTVVEGITDEAVARKLIIHVGAIPGTVYGKNGKPHIRQRIAGYNQAALRAPWLVVVDLDQDADCAPPLRAAWIPTPAPYLCFRVAVHEIEAWLMADAAALSGFLGVARNRLPNDPDAISAPKEALVHLARASQRRSIREDMAPREGSGRVVGPAYTSRIIEFVSRHWRPAEAAHQSDSLRRAIRGLERLVMNL